MEHFIEAVQRIGTIAIDTRGEGDRRMNCSEKYRKLMERLCTLSSGTQALVHECQMEFVTHLSESFKSQSSSSLTGQGTADIDLTGDQYIRKEKVEEHPRTIRPMLFHKK